MADEPSPSVFDLYASDQVPEGDPREHEGTRAYRFLRGEKTEPPTTSKTFATFGGYLRPAGGVVPFKRLP